MGERRRDTWWTSVEFWRGVCEVAVLYGYHPSFAHDINTVAASFPRGSLVGLIDSVNGCSSIIEGDKIRARRRLSVGGEWDPGDVMASTFDLLEYFYYGFSFLDPGTFLGGRCCLGKPLGYAAFAETRRLTQQQVHLQQPVNIDGKLPVRI